MTGIVVDLQEADMPVLVLPDGKYVAFYPQPMCRHQHDTPDAAAACAYNFQRFLARPEPQSPDDVEMTVVGAPE